LTENEKGKANCFRYVKSDVSCTLAVGRHLDMRPVKLSVKNLIFSDRLKTMATMVLRKEQIKYCCMQGKNGNFLIVYSVNCDTIVTK